MTADQIQAISGVATVVIAFATWYIAWKQNTLAKSQTELVDRQTTYAEMQLALSREQKDISERLTKLEEARDTPRVVAESLERIGDSAMRLTIANAGGGSIRSIWIHAATINAEDQYGAIHSLPLLVNQLVPFFRDRQSLSWTIAEPFRIPLEMEIRGVIAMKGTYYTKALEKMPLEFELIPGGLEVLKSQGWPERSGP